MLSTYFVITLLIPPALTALYYYIFVTQGPDDEMRTAQGIMAYLSWGMIIPVIFLVTEAIISGELPPVSTRHTWAAVLISLYTAEAILSCVLLLVLPKTKNSPQQGVTAVGAAFSCGYAILFAAIGWVLLMV